MVKWTVELGEHTIDFQIPAAKKAQVFADFLAEYPSKGIQVTKEPPEEGEFRRGEENPTNECWELCVDGSASFRTSVSGGAGVYLKIPNGGQRWNMR